MDSLQGQFLIATPQMSDPRFMETVIFLCAHNDEGAMGLIVNQPLKDVQLEDIFRNAEIPLPERPLGPVYLGGPVETSHVFVIYSTDYQLDNQLQVSPSVSLTRDPRLFYDLAGGFGPGNYLVTLGYSGWGPGQLEAELSVDGWLVLPARDEIIFATADHRKWRQAALVHGVDIGLFGGVSGSA
ncbi:YqgE/AlgH family protein [Desulfurivibrio dismutans]|uniref:YqgE/AlgH family protein n=1 Tax=Desulfurivibrio dismutans TaxID=1398908 RepID=UPI0023DC5089|nr:YqgE/AlgH family protein [Desulfurivibrio alkaliphilus]MDF1614795.1 YqgE/AlgH family protein [Desulfurivibrio alkaliphilus]